MDEAALAALKEKFKKALDSDINTSLAITAVYDVLKADTNDATKLAAIADFDYVLSLDLIEKAKAQKAKEAATVKTVGEIVIEGEGNPEIDAIVKARAEAKKAKNWAEADRIRDELKARGIEVIDTAQGAKWKRI